MYVGKNLDRRNLSYKKPRYKFVAQRVENSLVLLRAGSKTHSLRKNKLKRNDT